ncbi:hypothetical protein LQG66_03825 [Bradyrhizobium ontarionense]|uniref:Uncharacterized protein n=1 Tax=Bradyrhizobium ontarionense TaxID=2898149 RepID=A0ABY3RDG2_9BRAD|nr:hypothetical protein [Bradyrhizobium sp. A19]UFZ05455.1 hypothetical protein LQG66_03825 [Bradyrhizobium sp. A19]
MFKVVTNRTFTHDVKVQIPADGGHVEETLKTTFVCLPSEQLANYDLRTEGGASVFLEASVKTFHDLVDDDEQPIECTAELRTKLLCDPNIRLALSTHYFRAVTKAPEGN